MHKASSHGVKIVQPQFGKHTPFMCMFPTCRRLREIQKPATNRTLHGFFPSKITNNLVPFRIFVVYDVSLSYSSVPYKGVLQITTDSGTKNVCWERINYYEKYTVCRHLGYPRAYSVINVPAPTDAKDATFSGSINCNSREKYLSLCSITASASQSCSHLSYIECKCGKKNYIQGV